jgi:CRP/FNR family transcriptional regulator
MEIVQALRKTEWFSLLDEKTLAALAEKAVERSLTRDELLFSAGQEAAGLYVIVSGSVRAYRTGSDGREQVIHSEGAGATIGDLPVFDGLPYPSNVAAEEDSRLIFLDKQSVRTLCLTHPEIALSALRVLSKRLRRCAELVEKLSLHAVGQRVAELLLLEATSRGKQGPHGIELQPQLTKERIATRIGSVREVVSRAMARLERDGLVRSKGRRIIIPDPKRLAEYIGEI